MAAREERGERGTLGNDTVCLTFGHGEGGFIRHFLDGRVKARTSSRAEGSTWKNDKTLTLGRSQPLAVCCLTTLSSQ